ncbi:hypothetical protein ABLO27_17600 [Roseibium sp. SCPC15]|uniref:hypothetical protein n=1 Tax=Roseibium sp. SCP15 TaxID=3141376 RepID=UPI00333574DF
MDPRASEKQIVEEINQIQKHLLNKYGQEGVADEKLQEALRAWGRKGDDYREARKLIEGALIYNRSRVGISQGQEDTDQFLQQLGELGKVGPAVAGYGNSEAGRQRAREFLGLEKPVLKDSDLPIKEPLVPSAPSARQNNRVRHRRSIKEDVNPFDLTNPNLKQQAEMLEQNPAQAKQMIVAAGRDPGMFGFAKAA